jgi:type IV secretory pathway TrbD component
MTTTSIRRLPIHRSLIRPILLGGGERKLVMLNYTIIAVLLFGAGLNSLTIIAAILLASLGQIILLQLANYDAQFMQVYLRYRTYRHYYAAQSTLFNKLHPVRPAIVKGARP